MPRIARLMAAAILASALAVTVSAGEAQDPGPAAGGGDSPWPRLFSDQSLFGSQGPSSKPPTIPFGRGFSKGALPPAGSQTQPWMVVCGMTIVKGDASRDPKILHSTAAVSALFRTPVITPPVCQAPAPADVPAKR